jgi:hypothetical protein
MFINLSNHPSEKWGEEQKEEALLLGNDIVDIPFPNISPYLTSKEVDNLVAEYCGKIISLLNNEGIAYLHVMGELVFTHKIVDVFKNCPFIKCVASTTERNVIEADGKKTVTFKFVQFRNY